MDLIGKGSAVLPVIVIHISPLSFSYSKNDAAT